MSQRVLLASFGSAGDLLGAARDLRQRGLPLLNAYTPHPIHGLEDLLAWRGSRLPLVGLVCGACGVALMLWFQHWTSAVNWRINVGGRPWNSSLSFLCVTFEVMVLFAGLGTVLAFLIRSRLWPGRSPALAVPGATDDRYVLLVGQQDAAFDVIEVGRWLQPYTPLELSERELEAV
ncbi:MAG: DUF3341 domain-containing protein [Fimbriimonadaceae bacterium]|nr:DUF3341 domain-containing protein [Fimbriimonadaceae bacterium]